MFKALWWSIKNAYKGRYVMCGECEVVFRESQLKEIHCGDEYVEALVCPNCDCKEWFFVERML